MTKNIIQKILILFKDITDEGMKLLKDKEVLIEYLDILGIELPAGTDFDTANLPTTTNLDEFVATAADDIEDEQFLTAFADVSAVILYIEGLVRGIINAVDGEAEEAVEEILTATINLYLINFLRLRIPTFHAVIHMLGVINGNVIGGGGYVNLWNVISDWGRAVRSNDINRVSDIILLYFALLLTLIGRDLDENEEGAEIAWRYGWDGCENTPTPLADLVGERILSWSLKMDTDPKVIFYNSIGFIAEEHGGGIILDVGGAIDKTIKFKKNDKLSLKFDVDVEGIFILNGDSSSEWGDNNNFAITFKHDRDKVDIWKIISNPVFGFLLGTYSFTATVKPDELEVKFKQKLKIEYGKGNKSGFPYDFLPAETEEEELTIEFGAYLELKNVEDNKITPFFGKRKAKTEIDEESDEEESFLIKVLAYIYNAVDKKIAIHKDIKGVFGFENLYIKLQTNEDFSVTTNEISLDFWLKFGTALRINISRMGMSLDTEKVAGQDFNVNAGFKPPTGAGLRVDAGILTGGGFLYLDDEKGEYFGAFELSFDGLFNLNAIGIINTKMPDGSDGFSLLIILTFEFSVQLGGGFVLLGLGGLMGLNRRADVEVLRLGLKDNSIKSVLFPENVSANVHRIISDLKQIFPIQEGTFLVGLMAKIGYGTPTLISIELGIIVELPDPRIIILGVIKTILPEASAPILKLQVNFLGVIDFQNKFVYFEAHLYDSSLVGFPLTGSLALAVGWGDTGLFGISVGGFHPDFSDYPTVPTLPSAFRDMDRVSLQLLSGDNPKLGIELYLAVTSNSVQFGAKAELLVSGPMSFNLYGLLAFDALFIFDPFSFVISLQATLAIRKKRKVLFGIHFRGRLSGPSPWHIEGEVSFSLLFFDVTIGFDKTWGNPPPAVETVTEDLSVLVRQEIQNTRNWQVIIPSISSLSVRFRKPREEEEEDIIIYPFGGLSFSQRTLPFNFLIEKYGNNTPAGTDRFSITKVTIGNTTFTSFTSKQELFAVGHFISLSEKEKLSRKSFERMTGGFDLEAPGSITSADAGLAAVELDYELNYTYDDRPETPPIIWSMPFLMTNKLRRFAAVSQSPLSWKNSNKTPLNSPELIAINEANYTLANVSDLTPVHAEMQFNTRAEAEQAFQNIALQNPDLAEEILVLENF